jgi:hypothetical protein
MQKHSSPMKQVTRRSASGLRYLLEEVRLWTASLPELHDAFDADGLPLAFIVRRDSRPDASAEPRGTSPTRAGHPDRRGTRSVPTRRRGAPRKQMSNE